MKSIKIYVILFMLMLLTLGSNGQEHTFITCANVDVYRGSRDLSIVEILEHDKKNHIAADRDHKIVLILEEGGLTGYIKSTRYSDFTMDAKLHIADIDNNGNHIWRVEGKNSKGRSFLMYMDFSTDLFVYMVGENEATALVYTLKLLEVN